MDLLDSDPNFKYFHLDGQTIVVEDYYAIRPGQRSRPDSNQSKPKLKPKDSFVELTGNVLISAVKWAEDQRGPVIRMYNVESEESNISIKITGPYNTMLQTNLLEEPQMDEKKIDGMLEVKVGSKKIVTHKYFRN